MSNLNQRIPDEQVAEVLAEAARLHAETHKGHSLAELQQICSEVEIPAPLVEQAVKNVEEKRARQQVRRRESQASMKQQVARGLSVGMMLIPAIALFSLFIFRSQLNHQQTVTAIPSTPEPKVNPRPVLLQDDFRNRVKGRTKQEVVRAVGKPDSVIDAQGYESTDEVSNWYYYDSAEDLVSGTVGSTTILFENGVVRGVYFNRY